MKTDKKMTICKAREHESCGRKWYKIRIKRQADLIHKVKDPYTQDSSVKVVAVIFSNKNINFLLDLTSRDRQRSVSYQFTSQMSNGQRDIADRYHEPGTPSVAPHDCQGYGQMNDNLLPVRITLLRN